MGMKWDFLLKKMNLGRGNWYGNSLKGLIG